MLRGGPHLIGKDGEGGPHLIGKDGESDGKAGVGLIWEGWQGVGLI